MLDPDPPLVCCVVVVTVGRLGAVGAGLAGVITRTGVTVWPGVLVVGWVVRAAVVWT